MSPYAVIATGFAVIFGSALLIDMVARHGWTRLRPAGEAAHAILRGRVGRWLLMLGWLWTGFHFLAR